MTSVVIGGNNTNAPLYTQFAQSLQVDATGKLRTAIPNNQWWYNSSVDKDGDFRIVEYFNGLSAQSIYVQDLANTLLTPGLSSTGYTIRQSRRYFKFFPGIGNQVFTTFNFCGADPNTVKRIGQFNQNSGLFWELSGSSFNIVVRRRAFDGTVVEDRINSTAFNGDKLDGTGPSGLNFFATTSATGLTYSSVTPVAYPNNTLSAYDVVYNTNGAPVSSFNTTSTVTVSGITPSGYDGAAWISNIGNGTITLTYPFNPGVHVSDNNVTLTQTPFHAEWTFWFDYFGGRSGKARFVLATPSGPVILHTYSAAGRYGTQYVTDPSSPLREEIFNTATASYLPYFLGSSKSIDVEAETAINPLFVGATSSPNTWPTNTSHIEIPLIGFGLRTGEPYNRADLQLQSITIIDVANLQVGGVGGSTNSAFTWRLVFNPTLSGSIPTPKNAGKASRYWDYTTSAGYVSGGYTILQGTGISNAVITVPQALNYLNMGSDIFFQNPDQIVLLATQANPTGYAPTNTMSLVASLNWVEQL